MIGVVEGGLKVKSSQSGSTGAGKPTSLKERLDIYSGGLKNKRNFDIVDSIYDRAERRTAHQLGKKVYTDEHGRKHRLKDKTLAEEHLEKLEEAVTHEFVMNADLVKRNNVTDL